MTLGQTKALVKMLGGLEIPENLDSIGEIIEFLSGDTDVLGDVLNIILGVEGGIDWDEVPLARVEEIVTDFLAFNGGLVKRFAGYLASLSKSGTVKSPSGSK